MALNYNPKTGKFEDNSGAAPSPLASVQKSTPVLTSGDTATRWDPVKNEFVTGNPQPAVASSGGSPFGNAVKAIGSFVQNLPTTIASTVASPYDFLSNLVAAPARALGSGVVGKAFTNLIGYHPTQAQHEANVKLQQGFESPTTLPFQTTPILQGTAPKTPGQLAGLGLKAAIDTGLLLTTAGAGKAAVTAGEGVTKAAGETFLKSVLKPTHIAADAALGGGYGLASSLQDNANTNDTIKNILLGAGIGVVAAPLAGAGIKLASVGTETAIKTLEETFTKSAADKLSQVAELEAKQKATRLATGLPDETITQQIEGLRKSAARDTTIANLPLTAKTQFDSLAPVAKFSKSVAERVGQGAQDLRSLVQRTPDIGRNTAQDAVDTFTGILKDQGDLAPATSEYAQLKNIEDRIKLGQEQQVTPAELVQQMAALEKTVTDKYGAEAFAKVQEGQGKIVSFMDSELAAEVKSGRISDAQAAMFKEKHPNYTPNEVEAFVNNPSDYLAGGGGKSLSLAQNGFKTAVGSGRSILSTEQATVDRIAKGRILNAKNETLATVMKAASEHPDLSGYKIIRDAGKVSEQRDLISQLSATKQRFVSSIKELVSAKKVSRGFASKVDSISSEIDALSSQLSNLENGAQVGDNSGVLSGALKEKAQALVDKMNTRMGKIETLNAARGGANQSLSEITKAVNDLRSIRKQLYDGIQELVQPGKKAIESTIEGKTQLSYFINGVKQTVEVDKNLGYALKGLTGQEVGAVETWLENSLGGKLLTKPASVLRAITTQYNPFFSFTSNIPRDIADAFIKGGATPLDWAKVFARSVAKRFAPESDLALIARETEARMRDLGGLGGGLYSRAETGTELRMASRNGFNSTSKLFSLDTLKKIPNTISDINQFFEETTRKSVYEHAIKSGKSVNEAVQLMRDATVDFSRSGDTTRVLNKIVPFLNARVQGLAGLVEQAAKDPVGVARRLMYSSAYPTLYLNTRNSQFASYYTIPKWERQKYWIIMLGEQPGTDIKGAPNTVPIYAKIPKTEPQVLISSLLDNVLDIGHEKYPQTTGQFLGSMLGALSPVTESSILPTAIQIPFELASNYSLFKQAPIEGDYIWVPSLGKALPRDQVPPGERTTIGTSTIAAALGKAFNVSPIKIDYVIKTGALNDVLRSIDIAAKGLPSAQGNGGVDANTFLSTAAQSPVLRSIFGSDNYGDTQAAKLNKLQTQQATTETDILKSVRKTSATPKNVPGGVTRWDPVAKAFVTK